MNVNIALTEQMEAALADVKGPASMTMAATRILCGALGVETSQIRTMFCPCGHEWEVIKFRRRCPKCGSNAVLARP